MRFSFRLKLALGFVISMYWMIKSGDSSRAFALISASRHLGVEVSNVSGWTILFSYFFVLPLLCAIAIAIMIRCGLGLLSMLGIRSKPQARSPIFATRAEQQMREQSPKALDGNS